MSQLKITLESFQLKVKANQFIESRVTLIINLENLHWVTLVIAYKNDQYVGYYSDSKIIPFHQDIFNCYLIDF
ncbi:MAG: hypothetical protein WAW84_05810 [Candidatus Rickettsiella isopodorum]|jgi:hypothetical protein|nr:hypothetical protein [Pseudomonadota bacterium]